MTLIWLKMLLFSTPCLSMRPQSSTTVHASVHSEYMFQFPLMQLSFWLNPQVPRSRLFLFSCFYLCQHCCCCCFSVRLCIETTLGRRRCRRNAPLSRRKQMTAGTCQKTAFGTCWWFIVGCNFSFSLSVTFSSLILAQGFASIFRPADSQPVNHNWMILKDYLTLLTCICEGKSQKLPDASRQQTIKAPEHLLVLHYWSTISSIWDV